LCSPLIEPDRVRVLPKQHTPQRGLTIRSLSHNLALCPAGEVHIEWLRLHDEVHERVPDPFNLLLFPWPFTVSPRDFHIAETPEAQSLPRNQRLFDYSRATDHEAVLEELQAAVDAAQKIVHQLHGVVLPELALCEQEILHVERFCVERGLLLVAGVGRTGADDVPRNNVLVQPAGYLLKREARPEWIRDKLRREQAKHHRWCLDGPQIAQYGLSHILPQRCDCWEHVAIEKRSLRFVTLGNWLTVCCLICEDLARQDPMPDVVRAVGPNLIITLLMDGPQLRNRWSARYATVLAEDPGSSVLALTSLGMSLASKPRHGETSRGRVVGLWRDAKEGDKELELPEGHNAGILSISCHPARSSPPMEGPTRGSPISPYTRVFTQ
jgi:hypothetical protein